MTWTPETIWAWLILALMRHEHKQRTGGLL